MAMNILWSMSAYPRRKSSVVVSFSLSQTSGLLPSSNWRQEKEQKKPLWQHFECSCSTTAKRSEVSCSFAVYPRRGSFIAISFDLNRLLNCIYERDVVWEVWQSGRVRGRIDSLKFQSNDTQKDRSYDLWLIACCFFFSSTFLSVESHPNWLLRGCPRRRCHSIFCSPTHWSTFTSSILGHWAIFSWFFIFFFFFFASLQSVSRSFLIRSFVIFRCFSEFCLCCWCCCWCWWWWCCNRSSADDNNNNTNRTRNENNNRFLYRIASKRKNSNEGKKRIKRKKNIKFCGFRVLPVSYLV